MRGGYQILDLRGLNIQPNDTEVSIIDEYVLEQLLKIGDFIDDEAGLIANQLKPINILLPASSGYANLSLAEAGTLLIDAMVLGCHFVLTVVYGTAQDDYGNWVKNVDSAEYSYTELQSVTKLYKHIIVGANDDEITCVNTISTAIDDIDQIEEGLFLFGGYVITDLYGSGRIIYLSSSNPSSTEIVYWDIDDDGLKQVSLDFSSITDTVTEL